MFGRVAGGLGRGWGFGGLGAEGFDVLGGAAVVGAVRAGAEAEVAEDGSDDVEDRAGADVVFDVGGIEAFDEFGAEGFGAGIGLGVGFGAWGVGGDGVLDGAEDLSARGGAEFGGGCGVDLVLVGDRFLDFAGQEDGEADAEGCAVEAGVGVGFRGGGFGGCGFGCGVWLGHDFAVAFASDAHRQVGEVIEDGQLVLGAGVLLVLAGFGGWLGLGLHDWYMTLFLVWSQG